MFLYKYKKEVLTRLLKTTRTLAAPERFDLVPIPPRKKSKRPRPGTQILSQIPEDGEGNRGQIPHICPGSPPSGLTLIDA